MDWLTDGDWKLLTDTVLALVAALGVALAIAAVWRWRKGEPPVRSGDFRAFFENWGFVIAIVLGMPLAEIVERATGSELAGLLAYAALVMLCLLPPVWVAQHRMNGNAATHGIENAAAQPMPAVPMNREEKRVGLYATASAAVLALSLMGLATLAVFWALAPIRDGATGGAGSWRLVLVFILLLSFLALPIGLLAGRWPGEVRSRGSVDIAASPEQIWEKLAFRAGMPDWKGIYRSIERADGPVEAYWLHHYTDAACPDCGLPRHPDSEGLAQHVEVLEARAPTYYRMRSHSKGVDPEKGDSAGWLDWEENRYAIEPLGGGLCRVTLDIAVNRPKIWMAALVKLGGPVNQTLQGLKAAVEGGEDDSLYATARARIAVARAAPRHCGCASAQGLAAA